MDKRSRTVPLVVGNAHTTARLEDHVLYQVEVVPRPLVEISDLGTHPDLGRRGWGPGPGWVYVVVKYISCVELLRLSCMNPCMRYARRFMASRVKILLVQDAAILRSARGDHWADLGTSDWFCGCKRCIPSQTMHYKTSYSLLLPEAAGRERKKPSRDHRTRPTT